MTDTPIEIERMVREKIMARSPEERFIMGAQMFDAAMEMMRASLSPDLPETERKRIIFQRLYGDSKIHNIFGSPQDLGEKCQKTE